jgi:hypothetical protein
MISSDNTIGETSLFKVLETYFDEAWKRAEPLSGIRLWLSRAVTFIMSWQGVILIAIAIAALLFVNSILATILFFVYPVFLSVLWRRYDESKKF